MWDVPNCVNLWKACVFKIEPKNWIVVHFLSLRRITKMGLWKNIEARPLFARHDFGTSHTRHTEEYSCQYTSSTKLVSTWENMTSSKNGIMGRGWTNTQAYHFSPFFWRVTERYLLFNVEPPITWECIWMNESIHPSIIVMMYVDTI